MILQKKSLASTKESAYPQNLPNRIVSQLITPIKSQKRHHTACQYALQLILMKRVSVKMPTTTMFSQILQRDHRSSILIYVDIEKDLWDVEIWSSCLI